MKRIIILILGLFGIAQAQTIGYLRYDSVRIEKVGGNGELILLNGTRGVTNGVLTNIGGGRTQFVAPSGAATTVPISGLTVATVPNTIDNANYVQTWNWNSLGNSPGALTLSSNSTAAAGNNQILLRAEISGANSNASQTTVSTRIYNQHTGTSSTNVALDVIASGGTTNIAGRFRRGSVDLGETANYTGLLNFNGTTSGTVGLTTNAIAGTWTLTLPAAVPAGNGYLLQSTTTGISSWINPTSIVTATPTLQQVITAGSTLSSANTMAAADNTQTFTFNTLADLYGLRATSSNTTAGNGQTLFDVSLSGANASSSITTYAAQIANAHTGTTATNIGLGVTASGATTNNAIQVFATGSATTNNALTITASGASTNNAINILGGDVLGPATQNLFNTVTTTGTLFGAATTLTIGGTPTTAITHNYSTNATATATTKTVNFGTGGAAGSTTNINMGSAIGGTFSLPSPIITFGTTAAVINIGGGATTAKMRFFEPSASGANYSEFSAVAQAANLAYTFPPAFVAGGALTDVAGNGTLTWVVPGGFALTSGSGTTANGTAVDLGGTTTGPVAIITTTNTFDIDGTGVMRFGDASDNADRMKLVFDNTGAATATLGRAGSTFLTVDHLGGDINLTSTTTTISNLSGTGTRTVLADATGVLSAPISDRTVKDSIKTLDYGLSTLMKLNPVSFYYKPQFKNFGTLRQVGFIAQEVEKVMPNSVFTTPTTGLKGYNETDIIPVLVKAIQQQQLQIDDLKKEVELLKKN